MRNVVFIALFTAFIWVLGVFIIPIPSIPVPIVLQNLGILLVGMVLGIKGTFSVILLLFLAAIGLPVLPGGRGGIAVFFGPTAGYLYGYVVASFVIGLLSKRFWLHFNFILAFIFSLIGVLFIYLLGIPFLMINQNLEFSIVLKGQLIFIPFDIGKSIIVAYLAVLFKKYYPLITYHQ